MIWHCAGSARLTLKSEWIHVSEFLVAQHRRHCRRFDTGLDGIYVAEVLRAQSVDVRRDPLPDPFRMGIINLG